ncbi:aminopeptidase [Lentibacillus sp. CBA3610]|uniref:aminopeptidase n=1 Tax=Lentibacillus sp. CBA3610 TaxID=2518176 RepID=UPI0015954A86|nr:aminopeptidase [Lentibacillus sp. CBA3610]QKY69358.1 aminopeptidase [Lentibacillus sp. CBA3610]
MKSFQKKLEEYADLTIKVALNIQEGQKLRISADIENADFVELVTRKAYEAGAKKVYTDFNDPIIQRITYEKAPEEGLVEISDWQVNMFEEIVDEGGAFLKVYAPDPDFLEGIDPERIALNRRAIGKALNRYKKAQTNGDISWCLLSVPTKKWAAKVFPDLGTDMQIETLWDKIFYTSRINTDDPVTSWKKHLRDLQEKANHLNDKNISVLHYKAPGTNLTIGLADDHLWKTAQFTTKKGIQFLPNLPTEEVFTMPHKDKINGIVTSTKPLNYDGNLIENFSLTFENGKVIDCRAEKGEEHLKSILDIDDGTRSLGEVALVPHDSLISNLNLIFFNTLFDENASCHIALGNALSLNIKDAEKYSQEELAEMGFNESIGHIDFMIGSSNLDIDGETRDGKSIPIFRNGGWAF